MIFKKFNSPSEKFDMLIKLLQFTASNCGINIFVRNYKMTWITYTLFTFTGGYFIFVFWTMYNNFNEDWTIILTASVTLGSGMQGASKLVSFISDRDEIMDLCELFMEIYKDYEKRGDKYWKGLECSVEKVKTGLISLTTLYTVGFSGMIMMPLILYALTGRRTLVILFQIPGLDIDTDYGYFTTLIIQMAFVGGSAFGLYCADLGALVYLLQGFMFSYIFAANLESVNEMVKNPENNTQPCVDRALKDIIEWHQIYLHYTDKLNGILYYVITVQVLTAFVSTLLSVYLIIAGGWPGAYCYVLVAFSSLYIYCILGSENESAIQNFERDIYELHWYNLTVSQQKTVLQILCKTQKPQTIEIAGVMPLSVSTALQLTKAMYSITMFMFEFLVD
ncbi:odorant receptor 67d-like [Cochliomyia hominivorax]